MAFEPESVFVEISNILPVKQLQTRVKKTKKYLQIPASIREVGIIEPPVVVRERHDKDKFLLLDGYLRIEVLKDLGTDGVMCLVATEDEAFTYKKRVNRLATIQERKMILQAIERGVPQKRIAKALDVDVHNIRRKRRLRARDELGDARLHDFRLTVGTYGGQAGFNAFLVRNLLGHKTLSFYRLWYGKRPRSNQDLFTGLINPRRKVPSLADRQAVDAIVLATAKTDCDGAVLVGLGGYVVEVEGTASVRFSSSLLPGLR